MRIAYASTPGIDRVNGGLRQQVNHTIEGVRSAGIKADRIRSTEDLERNSPDLLHVFSVGFETIEFIRSAHRMRIPLVLSPVMYTNHSLAKLKWGLRTEKFFSKLFSRPDNEMIIKEEGCSLSDHLLPNTSREAELLKIVFGIQEDKITVVPNGVELIFEKGDPALFESEYGLRDFILFAGQSSAQRKNVISLLRISQKIDREVVIIGDFDDSEYSAECLKLASSAKNVTLIPTLNHDSELLRSAYAAAEVFVLPSWFETPGIAAMEAALAGCKIVITGKGGTREYFGNYADYVDPHSDDHIFAGIQKALERQYTDELREHIRKNYLWTHTVDMTLKAYRSVLDRVDQL